jgi:transposase
MERLVRLTDAQWRKLEPLLPKPTTNRGRPPKPHRVVIEGMLWILRTGAPWRDLPSAYGPWTSVYTRFSRWTKAGALSLLFEALARERDGEGYLIDATIVRAHQDAAGAAKKGAARNRALSRRSLHEGPRRSRCIG